MSDDPPRPASGQQSDPRPTTGAPAWWGALERPDLPSDGDAVLEPTPVVTPDPLPVPEPTPTRRSIRWRTWSFNVVFVLVAVLIVCVGLGVVSISMFLTCLLLFGVPLTVAAGAAAVVARRSR
jgi:hypothetical protein